MPLETSRRILNHELHPFLPMVEATFRVHLLSQASQSARTTSGMELTINLNVVEEVFVSLAPSGLVEQTLQRSSEVVVTN